MRNKRLTLFVSGISFLLILIIGISIYHAQTDPGTSYQQGKRLQTEAFNYLEETGYKKHNYTSALEKYKDALAKFEFVEENYPEWSGTHRDLLNAAKDESMKWIERIQAMPELDRAISCVNKEQFKEAIESFKAFEKKYKESIPHLVALAQSYRGSIYLKMGRYKDALDEFNAVLYNCKGAEQNQRNYCGMSLSSIGKIYLEMGKYEEASEIFKRVVIEYGEFPYAKVLKLSLELLPLERWYQMSKTYGDEWSSVWRGFFYAHASDEELKSFLLKKNKGDYFLVFKGLKLHSNGDLDEAKKYYKKYIATSKEKDEIYNLAVKALEKMGGR